MACFSGVGSGHHDAQCSFPSHVDGPAFKEQVRVHVVSQKDRVKSANSKKQTLNARLRCTGHTENGNEEQKRPCPLVPLTGSRFEFCH